MDDRGLRAELERLVPEPRDSLGWGDVLRRAGRIRRRRRRRTALVAVAVLLLTLVGALGAAGRLSRLLPHTQAPYLLVRGELRRADGVRVGAIQIELSRAAIAFGRHRRVRLWGRQPRESSFAARWFLDRDRSDDGGIAGVLRLPSGRRVVRLCSECGARDSGRLDLSYAQASALVDGRIVFALTGGRVRVAAARLVLDRAHLHRGLQCRRPTPPRHCTRIYTGR
jgi:hypothetical protein